MVIDRRRKKNSLTFFWVTSNKRITLIFFFATTNRSVRYDSTIRIKTTICIRTRINTTIVFTSFWEFTFRTADTFRTTWRRRASHGRETWTNWLSVRTLLALSIWSTWWWMTWILRHWCCGCSWINIIYLDFKFSIFLRVSLSWSSRIVSSHEANKGMRKIFLRSSWIR